MNKKHLTMILIAFLIVPLIVPQGCAQNETSESIFDELRILNFETETKLTFEEKDIPSGLLNPGAKLTITSTVEFKFNLPSLFPKFLAGTKIGNWIIFRDKEFNEPVNISLSVAEPLKWCDIELPEQVIIENIGTEFKSSEFVFNIHINESALAFEKENIKIKADFKPKTSWGLRESSGSDNFTIETNYVGKLNASFNLSSTSNEIIFQGGETKTLQLKIFNEYNGETIVEIQPSENLSKNGIWNISLEKKSIVLGPGENQNINVNISVEKLDSYKDTGDSFFEDIIVLTPKSNKNPTFGIGTQFSVKSPKLIVEEEESLTDILMMVIYAVIIIVVIAVVILFILKKLKR